MAWERKRKQAEADLRDQLNEAEDTITEMGDKVAKLERDLAAAKHDADIARDMVKSHVAEKAEIARDLKDEQVRKNVFALMIWWQNLRLLQKNSYKCSLQ